MSEKRACPPDVSLVLVSFHSSSVAGAAVASFRREASDLGIPVEVVVVDHSESDAEVGHLRALGPDRLLQRPNRGYAAGVNAGVAQTTGRIVLAGNPDVRFLPGSLAALLGAFDSGWDIVGPQFILGEFLFPPADLQAPLEEATRWLASRSIVAWRAYLRREVRRWRRLWEATGPVAMPGLSGALLGFRREVVKRMGQWDENYFLFFEETDWLRRAARLGLRIAQVPRARVEHLWGHAVAPERSFDYSLTSRARFLSSNFGWYGRLAARLRVDRTPLRPESLPVDPAMLPAGQFYWLLSPTTLGFHAAGWLGSAVDLAGVLRGVATARGKSPRCVLLTAVPRNGHVVGEWLWEGGDG